MISVVIPVYNAAGTLAESLTAIGRSDYDQYEVIVVDDASTDDGVGVASRHACRIVRLEENIGAAAAKNLGAKEARGDIILFTDADIVLQPDTLRLVAENLEDPTVSAVVGKGTAIRQLLQSVQEPVDALHIRPPSFKQRCGAGRGFVLYQHRGHPQGALPANGWL
jgi:glycosyltransferase involved in cell wall biosynthesis